MKTDDVRNIVSENKSDVNYHAQLIHLLTSEEVAEISESTKGKNK